MTFDQIATGQLRWLPELMFGYYECEPGNPYDESYFQIYINYENTPICEALNKARVDLVKRHYQGAVVDIGIGCGSFISAHGNAWGYDINPAAIDWLRDRDLYIEPHQIVAATFWDSFEHIRNPASILDEVTGWVFMSIPIFDGADHVLRSKHYRKDEHYWYFTSLGIREYMKLHGFECIDSSDMETKIGREDIGSFVFKRLL